MRSCRKMAAMCLGLSLLPAAGLAQEASRTEPSRETPAERNSDGNGLQFLDQALKLMRDAKAKADAKKKADAERQRREEEAAAAEQVQEPPVAKPEPAAQAPVQPATMAPVRKPRSVSAARVAEPKPAAPSITPTPKPAPAPQSKPPAFRPTPVPLTPSQRTDAGPATGISPVMLAAALALLVLLVAAAAFAARRLFGFAAPVPAVTSWADPGTVTAPQFEESAPELSIALMVSSPVFATAMDYPAAAP